MGGKKRPLSKDLNTLEKIIPKYVFIDSIIYIDDWEGYKKLNTLGYNYKTVNYGDNFVNPINGDHFHAVEPYWNKQKSRI